MFFETTFPMHWVYPKETTHYITMLREPAEQFESVLNYFDVAKKLGVSGNVGELENFLQNAAFYLNKGKREFHLLKNPSLFDLGFHTLYHRNFTAVENFIHFLQHEFDLVMLMGYFDVGKSKFVGFDLKKSALSELFVLQYRLFKSL